MNTATTAVRGFTQACTHDGVGGYPLLLVHGWPETRRIWERCVAPLAAAGFEVIAPDLRGFGDSDVAPDGFHDVPSHSRDLHALLTEHLGHEKALIVGGDLGGPVVQDLSLRFPELAERMVCSTRAPLRQGRHGRAQDPAAGRGRGLLHPPGPTPTASPPTSPPPTQRRRYIATFYTSRFWGHPGHFTAEDVDHMTEPFADAAKLRASFGGYESVFDESKRQRGPTDGEPEPDPHDDPVRHVRPRLYPEFDKMAAVVFPDRVGPFLLRDCGHFVQWEAADVLVSAIKAFGRDLLTR